MTLAPKTSLILCLLLINTALLGFAAVLARVQAMAPPSIQGVLLPQGRAIAPFRLLDHRHQAFTERELRGHWHLVSYGFTSCPDICPTTLAELTKLARLLEAHPHHELRLLFYSVDHRRDTSTALAGYVSFFHPTLIGLTHLDDPANGHLPFEQGLGIIAELTPSAAPIDGQQDNSYQVAHGILLFLINPEGQLQAIFQPGRDEHGADGFDAHTLYRDYLRIREYRGY